MLSYIKRGKVEVTNMKAILNCTQSVDVAATSISTDFKTSGILVSFNSFFTNALIPLSLEYLVKIGTGGTISSLLAACKW